MATVPEDGETNPGVISGIARAAVRPRPVWSSERAYIISALAGIIGLGAIWRFPYLAGEHGGGSFLLAYLVCMAGIAVPLAVVESAGGQAAGQSPVGLFRRLAGRPGRLFGWSLVLVTISLNSYYFVVTGWTLGYATDAATGRVQDFASFTGGWRSLWMLLVIGLLVYMVLLRGVGALEKASRVLVPLLALAVGCLAAYALTLDGSGEALRFLVTPDGEALAEGGTWRAAAGQAFYQAGIGQGFLIAYGSYSPAGLNLAKATGIVAVSSIVVAIAAALIVFPIVFSFGLTPDAGAELAFSAFPAVLGDLPAGTLIGVIFFALLFMAAFTSCLGGTAVVIAAVRDEFGVGAQRAAIAVLLVVVTLGVPSAISYTGAGLEVNGTPFLDVIDQATGSGLVIAVGLIGSSLVAWRMQRLRLLRSIRARRKRVGPITFSGAWFIAIARVLPPLGLLALAASLVT